MCIPDARAGHLLQHRISEVISLDAPACDESDEPVSGVIPDERCQFDEMMDSEDLATVRQAIAKCLTKQERFVIRQRFGLNGAIPTLDAIGKQTGCRRERVRKIEMQALGRLKQRLGEVLYLASV